MRRRAVVKQIADLIAPRANALVVLVGLAVLVAAAWSWDVRAGMVAMGVSLIVIGLEVPKR